MNKDDFIDEELEEELDKAIEKDRMKPNVFKILSNEKEAKNLREGRFKAKLKPKNSS